MTVRRIRLVASLAWAAGVLLHLFIYLLPFIMGTVPPVPQGEVYFANDVSFQAIVFFVAWSPVLLVVGLAIAVFIFILARRESNRSVNTDPPSAGR
jgi:hypothetical protein